MNETERSAARRFERVRQGRHIERKVREHWRGGGGLRGLAAALGVGRATLYSWFRGTSSPDTVTLTRLARMLGIEPADMLPGLEEAGWQPRKAHVAELPERSIGDVVGTGGVTWADADHPVGRIAQRMYDERFSQVPVTDGKQWTGLLTEEAIARWMVGRSHRGLELDERTPIREVLAYSEAADIYELVRPDTPGHRIAELFQRRAEGGRPIAAVLVTSDGSASGELIGIATEYDLPRLV